MRLRYFESTNFGDALNPYIFNQLLPGFFNDDPAIDFIGIGSILGLDVARDAPVKIVFSSGFAYGSKPTIDDSYKIYCVRGPLTAKALGLDPSLAIADGAILIKLLVETNMTKEYPFSFMPHWESELKYDWRGLCAELGIHYISPMAPYLNTLEEIKKTKVMLAEAMHAAIVSDALRVPWIPLKCYPGINEFKWNDWAESMSIRFQTNRVTSLFEDTAFNRKLCKEKIFGAVPGPVYGVGLKLYSQLQNFNQYKKAVREMREVMNLEPVLTKDDVLDSRINQLMSQLEVIGKSY